MYFLLFYFSNYYTREINEINNDNSYNNLPSVNNILLLIHSIDSIMKKIDIIEKRKNIMNHYL